MLFLYQHFSLFHSLLKIFFTVIQSLRPRDFVDKGDNQELSQLDFHAACYGCKRELTHLYIHKSSLKMFSFFIFKKNFSSLCFFVLKIFLI